MKLSITAHTLTFNGTVETDEVTDATSLVDLVKRLAAAPDSHVRGDLSIRFDMGDENLAPVIPAPPPAPPERLPGFPDPSLATKVFDDPPPPPPPPLGKAKPGTPGPSTIGTGPVHKEPKVDPADAWAIRVLLRELPNVGDRKKIVSMADDTSHRLSLRLAADNDPRFLLETFGIGRPVEVERVRA